MYVGDAIARQFLKGGLKAASRASGIAKEAAIRAVKKATLTAIR